MLLRRLKERVVKSRPQALQCIGTSATLGGEEKDFGRVAQFAEGLFGEPFAYNKAEPSQQDVVAGVRMDLTVVDRSWGKPKADFYLKWQGLVRGDDTDIFALKEACQDANIPSDVIMAAEVGSAGRWEAFIYRILAGDERVLALQRMLEEKPCYLKDAAAKLFVKDGEGPLVALVFLANRARLGDEEQPLLPARYHLFIRALEGGFCALLPRKQFFLERREQVEVDGQKYAVFETGVCQRCNSLYLVGERDDENVLRQPGNRFYENPNNLDFFLVLENGGLLPDNEDEIVASGIEYPAGEKYKLCGRCGANNPENYLEPPCDCGGEYLLPVVLVNSKEGNVHKCPACGRVLSVGSIVRRFTLGAEAVTSVLGTALYQQLPAGSEKSEGTLPDDAWSSPGVSQGALEDKRRLLVFSDSRQDAAFFATYFASSYEQILQRRLLVNVLENYREKVIDNRWHVQDLAEYAKRLLLELQIYPKLSRQQIEDIAWKWVLLEFMAFQGDISLEGLGMLSFVPVLPPGWEPPSALLGAPWNLTSQEATTLLYVLLDSIRRNGAIQYPDTVDPIDPFFAPRNREYFFTKSAPINGRIYSWLPASKSAVNARLNYLLKIPTATGDKASRREAMDLLAGIWDNLIAGQDNRASWRGHFHSFIDGANGMVFALGPDFWELRPAIIDERVKWYRCSKCKRLTLHNIRGVCPTYYCDGQLEEVDPSRELAGNHYRKLYTNFLPLSMKTHEHTAQLDMDKASEIQKLFTDGKVNILSCSTTFELGVDVGDLEVVFMRNVPPSAANYIQRAGRGHTKDRQHH
ncbi:MAG: hypothetical protein GX376_03685 [Firmicutes bacterium]|nr:hypothetical protein [Bacillota bacterium]